jgi:hypothetical protein
VIPTDRIFHSECLFIGLRNMFHVFFSFIFFCTFFFLLFHSFSFFVHWKLFFIPYCSYYDCLGFIMLSLICVCLLLFIHAFPLFLVHVLLCSLVVVHPFSLTISSCSSFKYLPNMLLFVGLALVLHWYDHLPPFLLYANLRMGSLKDLRFKAWTSLIK